MKWFKIMKDLVNIKYNNLCPVVMSLRLGDFFKGFLVGPKRRLVKALAWYSGNPDAVWYSTFLCDLGKVT